MDKIQIDHSLFMSSLENINEQVLAMKDLLLQSQNPDYTMPVIGRKLSGERIAPIKNEMAEILAMKIEESQFRTKDYALERQLEKKKHLLSTEIKSFRNEVHKIVLSGGPCAGKTTAITKLSELLRDRGYCVFIVPEAATMIFQSGGTLRFDKFTDEMKMKFQYFLMMIQMSLEDSLLGIACNSNPGCHVVLLCDRGVMDGSAYIEKSLWEQILHDYDLNIHRIRDQRYDFVIHISSAANGAEEHFSDKNNAARSETLEFARMIDRRLEEAWIDHPHFVQINNTFNTFEEKIQSVVDSVYQFLGIPVNTNFYNKFLVANPHDKIVGHLESKEQIKVHTFGLTDVIFFKDELKRELTYFRKRVG